MKKMILILLSLTSLTAQANYFPMFILSRTEHWGKGCTFQLADVDSRYAIEWRYADSYNWMLTNPNSGKPLSEAAAASCSGSTCTVKVKHFSKNTTYYFAARQFIDENGNGVHDDSEFVRDWTPPIPASNNADFIHRCSFSEN